MESFTNSVVLPQDLHEIKSEDFTRLDKKYKPFCFYTVFAIFRTRAKK